MNPTLPMTFGSLDAASAWIAQHNGTWHLVVLHAPACLHGRKHACTCSPDYLVKDLAADSLTEGVAAQREWLERHRSN